MLELTSDITLSGWTGRTICGRNTSFPMGTAVNNGLLRVILDDVGGDGVAKKTSTSSTDLCKFCGHGFMEV